LGLGAVLGAGLLLLRTKRLRLGARAGFTQSSLGGAARLALLVALEHWWKLVGAAGVLIAIASVFVQFHPGLPMGLALLFFGAGEWINHPLENEIEGTMIGSIYKVIGYRRRPKVFGLLLDALGIGIFGFIFL
jgi:hypothetical protein